MILLTGVGVIYKVHMQQGVGSGHPKCVQLRAVQGYRGLCLMCMYRSLFMFLAACLSHDVLYYLQKFSLLSILITLDYFC